MRRRTTPIGWPRYDPQQYRFALPNAVWEYKLKPVEFVIFSYLCYHSSTSKSTLEDIRVGVHITAGTVKKYLDSLATKKLVSEDSVPILMVYAYLLLIEDRKTHTCHPSYNSIASATGMSRNTALKSISILLEAGLIAVEPSSYFDKRGMKWKGNNLYTILPIHSAVGIFHQRQLRKLEQDTTKSRIARGIVV